MNPETPSSSVEEISFAGEFCLNCAASLSGPFCSSCGQKKVARLTRTQVGKEAWEMVRWFEMEVVRSALRLLTSPGTVAREYVLGKRKKHVHPLKLLLIAIGVLLVVLNQTQYLTSVHSSVEASNAFALVREYSKWSFSLGIIAIFLSAYAVFRGRLGYNLTEFLVLAIYCHFLSICFHIANQLPLLVMGSPEVLALHKEYSRYYMYLVNLALITVAFKQFFLIDVRKEWHKLVIAGALFTFLKWAVTHLYGKLVIEIVYYQMT